MKGFMEGYYNWTAHGGAQVIEYYDDPPALVSMGTPVAPNVATHWCDVEQMNWDQRMVHDAAGPHFFSAHPNSEPVGAYSSFPTDDQPLYNGCDESQLSAVARLVNIKAENNMSERCYDQDDIGLECCKFCGDPRYKPTKDQNPQCKKSPYVVLRYLPLIPQLQRLYASPMTAKHMTWHACHQTEEGSMCDPSDAEAWRHFDKSYPDFAVEPRNVRLALCNDGFAPHGQYGRTYSCWPIILTPYNFPPGMCMKLEYMFLTMVIPDPSNPKCCIDVYLEPLIKELLQLWH
ncbi:UNVERIFIED_CONTAM: hypothetical protein Slati_2141100, partial [Sesamum latifolium]